MEAAEATSREVTQAMNSPAITPTGSGLLLWVRRARGLFSGLSYVIVVSATYYFAPWLLGEVVDQSSSLSPATILSQALQVAGVWAALLPAWLITVVGVNLAPRAGTRRLLWLGCTALLGWMVNRLARGVPFEHNAAWLAGFGDGMLNAGLFVAVCVYHSHTQRATDTLLRTQIRRATLGAELRRAQLQFLQAQIEPHFLFNTLSAVRSLGRIDRGGTVEMLDNLMRYFSAALPNLRRDEAPLAEEMQLIDAYLGIYRVRMGARLGYEVALPKDLADVRVPSLMLLTLVENALKHGVNPTLGGGFIRVSATREHGSLLLKVADSGCGMSVRHGHGMGLANVRQRLTMLYGEAALLSLAHAEPRGVVATISIPLR
jgi:signal transduction histidine kinase